jgi:hypothetical protein
VLPVNNYYYFGTEEEAKNFFGIKDEEWLILTQHN